MNPDRISLGELLPGFDRQIYACTVDRLKRGFDRFRESVKGKPFVVVTFRRSTDIDASPTDSVQINKACGSEEDATVEATRIHDEICKSIVGDKSRESSFDLWVVAGNHWPPGMGSVMTGYAGAAPEQAPVYELRCVQSCLTKLKQSWYNIEYVCVTAWELPAGEDPVRVLLGATRFTEYREEMLHWFLEQGTDE